MNFEQVFRQGFDIFPDVISRAEAMKLSAVLPVVERATSRGGVRHLMRHPQVATLAQDPRLCEIAEGTLGARSFPFRATLFDKSPKANWLVAWHQDTALPLCDKHELAGWGPWSLKQGIHYAHAPSRILEQVVALRLQLDDSTEENGPLRVLPATHLVGRLTDAQIAELVSKIQPVRCAANAGGVVAMRPLIVHSSSKSSSSNPRRVLHIEYAPQSLLEAGINLAIA